MIEKDKITDYLFSEENTIYLKVNGGSQGKSVYKLDISNFKTKNIFSYGDCVIQRSVKPFEWFYTLNNTGIHTIRVTTVRDDKGIISKRGATLRVGVKKSDIVKSSTAIKVPIIDDEGSLSHFGLDPSWKRVYAHPDSQIVFKDKTVPFFKKAVSKCVDLHQLFPFFAIIGWGLMISKEGDVCVIEWNAKSPDIKFHEATLGPCFTDLNWEKYR